MNKGAELQLANVRTIVEYSEEDIRQIIEELARKFLATSPQGEIIAFRILEGANRFADRFADALHRATNFQMPINEQSVQIKRYGKKKKSKFQPRLVKGIDLKPEEMANKTILVLDTIIDEGITIEFFVNYLKSYMHNHDCRIIVVALISKCSKNGKIMDELNVPAIVGWEVKDDKFYVGFGLDLEKLFRGLPFIVYIPEEEPNEEVQVEELAA